MAGRFTDLAAKSRDCTGLSLEDKNSSWPQWHMIIRFVTSWCVCVVIKAFKSYCIASHRTVKAKDLELSSWSLFVVLLWTLNIPVSDLNQSNKQFSWFTSPNVLVTFYRADASVHNNVTFNKFLRPILLTTWLLIFNRDCAQLTKEPEEDDWYCRTCCDEQRETSSSHWQNKKRMKVELCWWHGGGGGHLVSQPVLCVVWFEKVSILLYRTALEIPGGLGGGRAWQKIEELCMCSYTGISWGEYGFFLELHVRLVALGGKLKGCME